MQPEILTPNNSGPRGALYVDPAAQHDGAATIKLLLYAIFKRKWQVLGIVAVVLLSILVAGLMRTKIYKTNAKVMIRPGRAEVQVGPGDDRAITLPVSATMEMMNSEMEILKSSELMRQVIARMEQAGAPIFGANPDRSLEEQVAVLKQLISVAPAPQSNVISIDFMARDPVKGQAILTALTQAYLERHAAVHGARGATEFFELQKQQLRRRVEGAEAAMRDFVEREGIVLPEDQVRWAFKDSMRNREAVRIQSSKIAALERHVATFRQQLASMPERILSDVERVNPTVSQLATELGQLEAKRANLLQLYNADDRMVTDLDAEIAEVKEQLEQSGDTTLIGRERLSANPLRQDTERQLLNAERNLIDLRARVAALPEAVRQQSMEDRDRAIELRKKSIEFTALDQEVMAARDAFRLYERKQEEARISDALDQSGILNVSILDTPSLPTRPANTMSPVMLVVALVAGSGLGVGTAVGLEFVGRNFKLEDQVEQHLELPVFAVIPDLSEISERTA